MASVLIINGVTVDRVATRVTLDRASGSMDAPEVLEFTERRLAAGLGSYHQGQTCVLSVDGTVVFSGRIVRSQPNNIGNGSINVAYTAYGLRWLANTIPITASDGSGYLAFNLPSTDGSYISGSSGKSVGDIVKTLLDLHATQLSAVGVTGYTALELSAMTVVPPEPVVLSGYLWSAIEDLIARWCNKYALWISNSDGLVHVVNTLTGLSSITLTLDSDPILLEGPSRDHSECFSKVTVRGGANIEGAYLRLSDNTLTKGWTTGDETGWTIADFYTPKDAADTGSISSMTSTTVTVSSDDATKAWATNYWAGQAAYLWAYNPAATGITFSEQRAITACTSLSAGGSATITVDTPFNNSGYTRYAIRGNRTGKSVVWRKFTIPNTWIAEHIQPRFAYAVHFNTQTPAIALTWTVTAVVCWSETGSPPYNEFPATLQVVLYDGVTDGYIIFDQPVVSVFNSRDVLEAGTYDPPNDIIVLVPYSKGALSVSRPSSGWEGTSYTVDGVQRELTIDYVDWRDARNVSQMGDLAQEHLDTRKDSIVEGSVTYLGKYTPALTLGKKLNLARAGGTTGWESLDAPVRSFELLWPQDGASSWVTRLNFSTRRRPFSGDRLYVHPSYGSEGAFKGSLEMGPIQAGQGTGFDAPVPAGGEGGIAPVDTSGLSRRGVRSGPKREAQRFTGPPKHLASNSPESRQGPPKPKTSIAGPPVAAKGSRDAMDAGNAVDDHERVMRGQTDVRDPQKVAKAEETNRINRDQTESAKRLAARRDKKKAIQSEEITDLRPIDDDPTKLAGN